MEKKQCEKCGKDLDVVLKDGSEQYADCNCEAVATDAEVATPDAAETPAETEANMLETPTPTAPTPTPTPDAPVEDAPKKEGAEADEASPSLSQEEPIPNRAKTILPSDRDPIHLNEVMKDQKLGIEWIKDREAALLKNWLDRLDDPEIDLSLIPDDYLKTIAHDYADLENDFNYVKDINTSMAVRFEEVWACLPTTTEIDALIKVMEEIKEDDEEFYCTAKKSNRLPKIKKLRSAMAHAMGNE